MPYAVHQGEAYFLFGKECGISKSRNNKWSDFSGRKDPADSSVEMTAAREFYEETIALPSLWSAAGGSGGGGKTYLKLAADMQERSVGYTYKFDRTYPNANDKYTTYLHRIPYDPSIPAQYADARRILIALQAAWQDYADYTAARPKDPLTMMYNDEEKLFARGTLVEEGGMVLSARHDKAAKKFVIALAGRAAAVEIFESACRPFLFLNYCVTACEMQKKCDDLFAQAEAIWGGAAPMPYTCTRGPDGTVLSVRVNECYLEKQCLMWRSLGWIKHIVSEGGVFGQESFRANFAPMLALFAMMEVNPEQKTLEFSSAIQQTEKKKGLYYGGAAENMTVLIDIEPWAMTTHHALPMTMPTCGENHT